MFCERCGFETAQPARDRSTLCPHCGTIFNSARAYTRNNNALLVEIILSLFGLFGVGWLMAGETAIGAFLLIGSIFIYWPLIILGTMFTLGLGLICLGPLAIAGIIVNIVLLNKVLLARVTRIMHAPDWGRRVGDTSL